jgi:transcriptional regulator with XRE-family HTH domain
MAVAAHFDILPEGNGKRGTARQHMRLRVRGAAASGGAADVLIHNLSPTGLLLESATRLEVGDEIVVELPEAASSIAQVVWTSGQFYGCAFDLPLSAAALSAAQLRSEPAIEPSPPVGPDAGQVDLHPAESFGARMQRLRRTRGLTLVEFARRANVSRPTVWSWEADRSTPRRSKTAILLEVLGVTEAELFGDVGSPDRAQPGSADANREDALRQAIGAAKRQIAGLAGTTPDKVTLIIEV